MIHFEENICCKIEYISYILYIYSIYKLSLLYFYCFSEQQKINSGYFLFEAEKKAKKTKKANKDIAQKSNMHQPKQYKSYVNAKNILAAHSSDESSLTAESFNN